jgi:pimeloyl-ACP methyl ester carboxylesterase
MQFHLRETLVLASYINLVAAFSIKIPPANCTPVSFLISAATQNVVFLSPPDPNNQTAIIEFFYSGLANGTGPAIKGTTTVSGNYIIDGTYCCPTSGPPKALEILVHGISYNKSIWSGLGINSTYNWQLYAASQGYSTLAIDRLGHGSDPQHPDPLNVVQGRLDIEIIHQLIHTVRTNPLNPLLRTFSKIIYVSHSYAGWLGSGLANAYPTDADVMVFTGFSAAVSFAPFFNTQLASASILNPARFLGLPLGYITTAQAAQRTALFYAGGFSQAVAQQDYAMEDTWTIGETGNLGFVVPATSYTGALYVTAGVEDILFCQTPITTCEQILNDTRTALFPSVEKFNYSAIENTGHVLMMHYSAPTMFSQVHQFLDTI